MSDPTSTSFAPSPQQRRAAQVERLFPASSKAIGAAFRVVGSLDTAALTRALEQLGADNEILRTRVIPHGEGLAQVVDSKLRLNVDQAGEQASDAHGALLAFASAAFPPQEAREGSTDGAHIAARLQPVAGEPHLLLSLRTWGADAKSLDILASGLVQILSGARPEQPRDDEGQALQYADLATLQEELLGDEDSRAGAQHLASLPLTRAADQRLGLERPLEERAAPHEFVRVLSQGELAALASVAQRSECSRAAVALAAWSIIVARQSDVPEPLLALASAGRDFEGLDLALGPFEKHVPLTLGPRTDESFDELVRRAEAAIEGALNDHDAWDPAAPDSPRLLPHAFAWRAAHATQSGDLTLQLVARSGQSDHSRACAAFEGLVLPDGNTGLCLRMAVDPSALDEGAAGALADQVLALILDAQLRPLPQAGLQSAAGERWRRHFAQHLATTPADKRRVETITRLFGEAAKESEAGIALRDREQSCTFGELDRRTNRIARHLMAAGLQPGQFVGLHLERGLPMVEAILGVLKAGAAYLPLPPSYPDERLRFMLEDTGAPLVITSTLRSGDLPQTQAGILILDQLEEELAQQDDAALSEGHGPEHPAYVIYTSGSTGKPKGVPITHANLCHSIRARQEYYPGRVGSYLLLSSFAFDSSVPGIFWTLTCGGTLVLPPEGTERELGQLPGIIKEHGVTHLLALPSVFDLLLEVAQPGDLDSLDAVIVAGESASPDLVERHAQKLPHCALYDEYGPTENTVWSTVQRCSTSDAFFTVPIGRPVPGVCVLVAEGTSGAPPSSAQTANQAPNLAPAPAGMSGELLVGGPQLTPGYLGREELTAERFIESPGGVRLYRTGDLARMHPEGTIEFLGRMDHQVKLRGYRIELEEIEAQLSEHDQVREAVVCAPEFASEGNPSDRRLVGYLLPKGSSIDIEEVRSRLGKRLPEYMLPAHFVVLDEFPRLPNGKIDRKALPLPSAQGERSTAGGAADGNPLERLIAHLWAELLDTDKVDLDEDFFDLGGHSLLAARFFAQLNETLGIEAPLRFLFDSPSVRGLSAAIEAADDGARAVRAAELTLEVLGLDAGSNVDDDGDRAAPRGALERLVGSLWADGLGLEEGIDPEGDFFDLGGHSLLAARLFAQMNELLQIEAPLRLLFDNPTLRGLCRALGGDDPGEAARLERTAELTLEVLEGD